MLANTTKPRFKPVELLDQPIFFSLLDCDAYKWPMMQVNYHQYPSAWAKYRFKCRTPGVDLVPLIPALRRQVDEVGKLEYRDSDLRYLREQKHLSKDFVDYLSDFRLDPKHVTIQNVNGEVDISFEGPMLKASMWEIFILGMVNELYFRVTQPEPNLDEGRRRLMEKINMLKDRPYMEGFNIVDFGTRRRFSREWHAEVVDTLSKTVPEYFSGTSNFYFAKELKLPAVGTMAHEYLQAWQGLVHPLDSQKAALNGWMDEFRGQLDVALTDVFNMNAFCKDMDLQIAKVMGGFRHDSGCPVEWGYKLIDRLNELGIDPRTKTAVFSDGLDMEKCISLYEEFKGKIKTSFGVGTNLTNDLGYTPLNVVAKVIEVNGRPVAKLSDSPGKTMCEDENYVAWLKSSFEK